MGLYSSNCRRIFVCLAVNWEPLGHFTSNFAQLLEFMVCILFGEIGIFHSRVMGLYSSNCRRFFVCRAINWEPSWPIHFKLRIVIGIDSLMVCILFGEIGIFHSRIMGLYSSNCRRFFVCRAVNWELLRQFTSSFVLLLELMVFTDFSKKCVVLLFKWFFFNFVD